MQALCWTAQHPNMLVLLQVLPHAAQSAGLHDSRIHSHYSASTSQRQSDSPTDSSTFQWRHVHRQPVVEMAEHYTDDMPASGHETYSRAQSIGVPPSVPNPPPPRAGQGWLQWFGLGALAAIVLQFVVGWLLVSPVWERFFGRFVWNRGEKSKEEPQAAAAGVPATESTALVLYSDSAETVEWVNMMWRKVQPIPVGHVTCIRCPYQTYMGYFDSMAVSLPLPTTQTVMT